MLLTIFPGVNPSLDPLLLHRTKGILGAESSGVKDFLVRRNTRLSGRRNGKQTLK
jgi:hypothetical protein